MNIERPNELLDYLRESGHLPANESVTFETLAGGVSNRTVLVRRKNPPNWVIKQSLPKLRVEVDWFCDPLRIHREAEGLRALQKLLNPGQVPEFQFEDDDHRLFAMTAIAEPHDNWKQLFLAGAIDEQLLIQSAEILSAIHTRSAIQQSELKPKFKDRSYFESLRLEPYYRFAAEQAPEAKPFLVQLLETTRSHEQTLVHGDFSPKNILVHHSRLVLLDYEVIHWGAPSFDIGFFLTHLISKAHHLPEDRERFLSAAKFWWKRYFSNTHQQQWAQNLEQRVVSQTLGCLLARVRGRSPLEYLSEVERHRQADAVIALMTSDCTSIDKLCERFSRLIQ